MEGLGQVVGVRWDPGLHGHQLGVKGLRQGVGVGLLGQEEEMEIRDKGQHVHHLFSVKLSVPDVVT